MVCARQNDSIHCLAGEIEESMDGLVRDRSKVIVLSQCLSLKTTLYGGVKVTDGIFYVICLMPFSTFLFSFLIIPCEFTGRISLWSYLDGLFYVGVHLDECFKAIRSNLREAYSGHRP